MYLKNIFFFSLFFIIVGCDQQSTNIETPETEVGIVTLKNSTVTITSELIGRVTSAMTADVRPQVSGIVKARLFTEGDDVTAGQILYQIDPLSYQATYDQAVAQLNNEKSTLKSTKLKAERYAALLKVNGVSRQDADEVEAAYQQNLASVAQYQAAADSAKINLDYTQVKAPISGRIGISSVTQGALVTENQTDALATIRSLSPIYVDMTQSSAQRLKLRNQFSFLQNKQQNAAVHLKLEDGSDYSQVGQLELVEVAVDQSTGSVTLRAAFPNNENELLPGMYVTAIVDNGTIANAILAPQQGVTRDVKGNATALVVNNDNKVELRNLETERVIGSNWLITKGLQAGDRIIVEGTSKVSIGDKVKTVEIDLNSDNKEETALDTGSN